MKFELQIGCMIIIMFIATLYFTAKRRRTYSHVLFSFSIGVTACNLVLDMMASYTISHMDVINPEFNKWSHILYFATLAVELFICCLYSLTLIYDDRTAKRRSLLLTIPVCLSVPGLLLLPLDYVETPNGNYSRGPAEVSVYAILAFYLVFILIGLIRHWKEINQKKRFVAVLAFAVQAAVLIYQGFVPVMTICGAALTLINLAFFLTVESPDVLLMEQLREEKERADEANEAKSQFLSNMSHEIRTPMNAIVGLTEVMLRKEWPEQEERYLTNIKNSGDALLALINDLLDFSKVESGKFVISEEDYEPLSMMEDLKVIFLNRIGDKKIDLKCDIDPQLPRVLCGDGMRIRQIIINLANNAIKFTETGYVKLSIQVLHRRQDAVEICVSVQDSGQGIKKEDINKLFDAFTQVDIKKNRGKEGTGLGLAICKQLVELMGGTINVKSQYGKGSDFYFTLWQKAVSSETVGQVTEGNRVERKKAAEFEYTAPCARLLLVDDNELNREVAAALLAPLKMQIDVAENGLEAYEMIQKKRYDIVFMDHYMPVMDGVEATVKIRELEDNYYRDVPILALTADAVAGEKEKFIAAGMNDVVSKPVRIKEICEKIRYYLPEEMVQTGEAAADGADR